MSKLGARLDTAQAIAALTERLATRDIDAAERVVRDNWFELLDGNTRGELQALLERVPADAVPASPLLTAMMGLTFCARPDRRARGIRYLTIAAAAAERSAEHGSKADRVLLFTAAGIAHRLVGRASLGATAARSALRLLDSMGENDRRALRHGTAIFAQNGATLYAAGSVLQAVDAFECGLAEVPRDGDPFGFANLAMLAGISAIQGNLPEAERYVAEAADMRWAEAKHANAAPSFFEIAQALIALERFDAGSARRHLSVTLDDRHIVEHWIPIAVTEARTELIAGRPGAARAALDAFASMRGSEGRSAAAREMLAPTRALIHLALGNPEAAAAVLRREAPASPSRNIARARVELAMGRHGAALQLVREIAGAPVSPRVQAEATTIEVAALLRFSNRIRARAAVDELGELLMRTKQRVAVLFVPESDGERLRAALTEAGFDDVVTGLPPASLLLDSEPEARLSKRELAVLHQLLRHSSASMIASELMVSVNTVKTQLKSIYRKLGVSTRDEAIAVALDHYLVEAKNRG